jgi:hypothetical protein
MIYKNIRITNIIDMFLPELAVWILEQVYFDFDKTIEDQRPEPVTSGYSPLFVINTTP